MKGKAGIRLSIFLLTLGACVDVPEPVPPPPVPTQDQCPAGFEPLAGVGDGCYITIGSADWVRGEEACEQFVSHKKHAHLIIVDRDAEHVALSHLTSGSMGDIWIGRLQQDPDDAYRNINYIDYAPTFFGQGEPNDYGTGDCQSIFGCGEGHPGGGDERCIEYKHETGLWNDEKCFRDDRVICEWDGVNPYDWRPDGD